MSALRLFLNESFESQAAPYLTISNSDPPDGTWGASTYNMRMSLEAYRPTFTIWHGWAKMIRKRRRHTSY